MARTIADLAPLRFALREGAARGCEEIGPMHLAEALPDRPKIMMVQPRPIEISPDT